jgi:hypothetical protein
MLVHVTYVSTSLLQTRGEKTIQRNMVDPAIQEGISLVSNVVLKNSGCVSVHASCTQLFYLNAKDKEGI